MLASLSAGTTRELLMDCRLTEALSAAAPLHPPRMLIDADELSNRSVWP